MERGRLATQSGDENLGLNATFKLLPDSPNEDAPINVSQRAIKASGGGGGGSGATNGESLQQQDDTDAANHGACSATSDTVSSPFSATASRRFQVNFLLNSSASRNRSLPRPAEEGRR